MISSAFYLASRVRGALRRELISRRIPSRPMFQLHWMPYFLCQADSDAAAKVFLPEAMPRWLVERYHSPEVRIAMLRFGDVPQEGAFPAI